MKAHTCNDKHLTFQSEDQEIDLIMNQRLVKLRCVLRGTYQLANQDMAMRPSLKAALAMASQMMVKIHCQAKKIF